MKVQFRSFVLDTASRQLTHAGTAKHLSPKAFELLSMLIERRPAVVDKAAIRQRLWPGVHVVEASVTNLVAEIRAVLSEDHAGTGSVRTVHGLGYAFDADVVDVADERAQEPPRPAPFWIIWKDRPVALAGGENVIGRDAACTVWIDASGVSRRHASIHVTADGRDQSATLEDLNSTNGTYVGGKRITDVHRLESGDRIRVGGATLTFRASKAGDAPTKRVRPPKGRR